jgi:hypothetical protein
VSMEGFVDGVIFVFTVFGIIMLVMLLNKSLPVTHTSQYREAIQQCEAELPRYQKCKAVITAEVIDE